MNIKLFARLCLLGMLAVFTVEKASAATYNLNFTASGATILGGIIFDKSDTDFSVISLISTDLTIEGHLYSIGDLHSDIAGPNVRICSAPNCEVANATNDFLLRYNRTTGAFNAFVLGTPFFGIDSGTTTLTQGQQLSAVPVPAVGAGLPGLILAGGLLHWWRRRKAATAVALPDFKLLRPLA